VIAHSYSSGTAPHLYSRTNLRSEPLSGLQCVFRNVTMKMPNDSTVQEATLSISLDWMQGGFSCRGFCALIARKAMLPGEQPPGSRGSHGSDEIQDVSKISLQLWQLVFYYCMLLATVNS
jgi:hypothetical protein